jgi:hypothetical protein
MYVRTVAVEALAATAAIARAGYTRRCSCAMRYVTRMHAAVSAQCSSNSRAACCATLLPLLLLLLLLLMLRVLCLEDDYDHNNDCNDSHDDAYHTALPLTHCFCLLYCILLVCITAATVAVQHITRACMREYEPFCMR